MKKVLVLDMNSILKNRYLNIDVFSPYWELSSIYQRILRKIWITLGATKKIWYGKWKKYIHDYDVIIMNDTFYDKELLGFINSVNPKARKIMYYYNPIASLNSEKQPYNIDRSITELWSVDREDCKRYNMQHNSLPFEPLDIPETIKLKWDVVFIGLDKGRAEYVNNLFEFFDTIGLKTFSFIYPSYSNIQHLLLVYYNKIMRRKHKMYMDYRTVLEYSKQSKAILEIVQEGQSCYTFRAMEALFLNRKLITNNKYIVKEGFYNSANIFVLGVDDMEGMSTFVTAECKPAPKELLEEYNYDSWLRKFGIDVWKHK